MQKTRKLLMGGYLMGIIIAVVMAVTSLSGCLFQKSIDAGAAAGAAAPALAGELAAGSSYDPNATSLTFGAGAFYNTSRPYDNKTVKLSATKSVILFRDMATGGRLKAVVADISGTSVNIGPKQSIDDNCTGCTMASIAALSTTRIVVAYPDTNDSNHGVARTCDVSGASITCNATSAFSTNGISMGNTSVAALDSGKFVVGYFDNGTAGKANIGTVAGEGSITYGATATFESGIMMVLQSSSALSASQFVIAYEDGSDMHGKAIVGTVSGTNITFGIESVFNNQATSLSLATAPLSANTLVITYGKQDGSGAALIGSVVGSGAAAGIFVGSEVYFSDNLEQDLAVSALASDKFVVSCVNNNILNYGGSGAVATIGKVSGSTITLGWGYVFHTYGFSKPAYNAISALSDKTFLNIVCDKETNKGVAYFGTVSAM